MQPIKIFNIKNGISFIRYIGENKLVVVDSLNTIRIYDLGEMKLINGFKIKLPQNNPLENSVSVSKNGKYVAIAIKKKRKVSIWDIQEKKLLYTLGWHRGDILAVDFDENEKYLLTGAEDGRSYMWSLSSGKMVLTLPSHADYVTAIKFNKNGLWAAIGTYDRYVTVANLNDIELSIKKKSHKSAVVKLKFLKNKYLISGDKTGELIVWIYSTGQIASRLTPMIDRINDFTFSKDFLFAVSDNNKKVALYDLEKFEEISNEFIKLLEIPSTIEYIEDLNYLVIGTKEGSVYIYDLLSDEKQLQEFTMKNEFEKVYEIISKNPFLKRTSLYTILENRWNKILSQAHSFLERGEKETAKKLLSPFLKIPSKRAFVQSLLNDFSEFEKFKKAVLSKKYPLAYSLAAKYPYLKNTAYYKKMEEEWRKKFAKAKILINKKGMEDEVKELLKPFRGVPQKTPLIQALFTEKQLYALLLQKLHKKDFEEFFHLINRHPFLTESEEYEKAVEYGKKLLESAKDLLKKGEYKKVINIAEILARFPMYKNEAIELEEEAKILAEFQRLLALKDYEKILKFVEKYPFLEENEEFKQLEKEWKNIFNKAEAYAFKGEISKVLNIAQKYMNIKEKRMAIAQLIKSAYLQEIISLIAKAKKGVNVKEYFEKGIKNYIKIFGFDLEINDLIEQAKKIGLSVDLEGIEEGDIKEFYLHKLPNRIWENI